MAKLMYDAI
jgi:dihydrofolate reductase